MLKKHVKESHKNNKVPSESRRIRPLRIAAKRQREMMAVLVDNYNHEYAEWIEEQDLDVMGVNTDNIKQKAATAPVLTVKEYMVVPWEEDK